MPTRSRMARYAGRAGSGWDMPCVPCGGTRQTSTARRWSTSHRWPADSTTTNYEPTFLASERVSELRDSLAAARGSPGGATGRSHGARGRRPALVDPAPDRQGDRRGALPQSPHRQHARGQYLQQTRGRQPTRGGGRRRRPWPRLSAGIRSDYRAALRAPIRNSVTETDVPSRGEAHPGVVSGTSRATRIDRAAGDLTPGRT